MARGVPDLDSSVYPFGKNLRHLRIERGLTHRQLAEMAGIGHTTVSSLERGKVTNPGCYMTYRLALALRVAMEDLMGVSRLSERVRIARNPSGQLVKENSEAPIDSPTTSEAGG